MKPILYILFAIVLAMLLCCEVEGAGPYNCGPNGCGPQYGRASVGQARGPVRAAFRARGPLRRLFGRLRSRGCRGC